MVKYEIWARKSRLQPVTPEIFFHVSEQEFHLTDAKWTAYKQVHCPNPPPAHHDWHWHRKGSSLDPSIFVALKVAGEVEGLMMVSLNPRGCSHPESKGGFLLYIEYLETAPWNQKAYAGQTARFAGIGSCLIDVAVDLSDQRGCGGRLGLHSLDDAKSFYEDQGFENLGTDPIEELDYFELPDSELEQMEQI